MTVLKLIDGRFAGAIDTDANWLATDPIIYRGEQVSVTDDSGVVIGYKVGTVAYPTGSHYSALDLNGMNGEDGSATVTIGTVTTGAPGSDATVVNSGTETDAVLDFSIPAGADGVGGDMLKADNLSGLADYATARTNLGLGTAATHAAGDFAAAADLTTETARATTAEALLAPKASPALTGNPTAPTQTAANNSTRVATTAYADGAVATETARAEAAEGTLTTNVAAEVTRAETAEALLAPLASPALTGNPTATTQSAGNNSTRLATTAYTDAAVGVENSRATTAEALLAPKASPALTGSPTVNGAPLEPFVPVVAWAATTAFMAYQAVQLPTGGVAYTTSARTSRSAFDATERATWTFLPSGHYEKIAASETWVNPTGIARKRGKLVAGGAGGNGGSSATTSGGVATQVGGASGGCGNFVEFDYENATNLTFTIGAGGAKGTGGAANNNPGTQGGAGGDSTVTDGTTAYTAKGGAPGQTTSGNSTATANGGAFGLGQTGNFFTIGPRVPGCGAEAASNYGYEAAPLGNFCSGGSGAPASATLGGAAGLVPAGIGQYALGGGTGHTGTTAGGSATGTSLPGSGGPGGGGGAPGGAGGDGLAGGAGYAEVWF